MPESTDIIRRRCEMFESYCKNVLRNYARDLERAARRLEDREILTDVPLEYVRAETDDENSHTVPCRGAPCVITDETLYAISTIAKMCRGEHCDYAMSVRAAKLLGVKFTSLFREEKNSDPLTMPSEIRVALSSLHLLF